MYIIKGELNMSDKNYGVRYHYRDETPGFRESYDETEWFETESERDARFEELNHSHSGLQYDHRGLEYESFDDYSNVAKVER